jgi:hypothetical protein
MNLNRINQKLETASRNRHKALTIGKRRRAKMWMHEHMRWTRTYNLWATRSEWSIALATRRWKKIIKPEKRARKADLVRAIRRTWGIM